MRGYAIAVLVGILALARGQWSPKAPRTMQGQVMQDIANEFSSQQPEHQGQCQEGWNFPNPCTPDNLARNITIFPHPHSNNKFLMCGDFGKLYIVNCPRYEIYHKGCRQCVAKGSKLTTACEIHDLPLAESIYVNPCTQEAIISDKLFFAFPNNLGKYIHCDAWGKAWEMICTPGEVWDPYKIACVDPALMNPCVHSLKAPGHLFKHPCDPTKYIRCDADLVPYEIPCTGGDIFSETNQVCQSASLYKSLPKNICGQYRFRFRTYSPSTFKMDPTQQLASTASLGTQTMISGMPAGAIKPDGNINTLISAWQDTVKPVDTAVSTGTDQGMNFGTGGGFNTARAPDQSVGSNTGMQGGAIISGQSSLMMTGQGGAISQDGSMISSQGGGMIGQSGSMMTDQGAAFTSQGGVDRTTGQTFGTGASGTAGGMSSSSGSGIEQQTSGTGSLTMVGDFASSSGLNAASGVLNSALAIQGTQTGMGQVGVDQSFGVGSDTSQSSGVLDPFSTTASQGAGSTVDLIPVGANAGRAAGVDAQQIGIDTVGFGAGTAEVVSGGGEIGGGGQAGMMGGREQVDMMGGGGQVDMIGGSGQSGMIGGSGQSGMMGGSGQSGMMRGSRQAGMMGDSGQFGMMGGSRQADMMGEGGQAGMMGGSGQAGMMRGSGQVDMMRGSGPVDMMGGSGQTGMMGGSDQTGMLGGSGQVDMMGGGSQTGIMGGSGQTVMMGGSGQTGMMGGSGHAGMMGGSEQVDMMRGSEQAGMVGGSGQAGMMGGSGQADSMLGSWQAGMMGGSGQAGMMGGSGQAGMMGGGGQTDAAFSASTGSQTGAMEFGTASNTMADAGVFALNAQTGAATDGISGIDALASAVAGIIDTSQFAQGMDVATSTGSQTIDTARYKDTGPIVDAFAPTGSGLDTSGTGTSSFSNNAGTMSFGTDTTGAMDAASSGSTGTSGTGMVANTGTGSNTRQFSFFGTDSGSTGTAKFDSTGSIAADTSNPGSSDLNMFGPGDVSGSSGTAAFETIAVGSATPQSTGVDASGNALTGSTGVQFTGADRVGNTAPGSMDAAMLDTSGSGTSGGTMFDIGTGSVNNIFDSAGGIDSAKLRSLVGALFDQSIADGSIGTVSVDTSGTGTAGSAGASMFDTTGQAGSGSTTFDATGQAASSGSSMFETAGQGMGGSTMFDTQGTSSGSSNMFENTGSGRGSSVGVDMTWTGSSGTVGVEHAGTGGANAIVFDSTSAGSGTGSSGGAASDIFGSGQPQSMLFDNTGSQMIVDPSSSSGAIGVESQGQFGTSAGHTSGVMDVGMGTGMESNLLDPSSRGAASGIGQSSFIDAAAGTGRVQTSFVDSTGGNTGSVTAQTSFDGGVTGQTTFGDFSGMGTGGGSQASLMVDSNVGTGNAGQAAHFGETGGQGNGQGTGQRSFVDASGSSFSGAGQFLDFPSSTGGVVSQQVATGTGGVSGAAGNTIDVVVNPNLVDTVSVDSTGSAGGQGSSSGNVADFGVSGTQFLTTDGSLGTGQPQVSQGFTGQVSAQEVGTSGGAGQQTISVGTPGAGGATNFNTINDVGSKVGGQLVETQPPHPSLMREYTYSDRPFTDPCTKRNLKHSRTHFKLVNNPHSFIQCDAEGNMYVMKCNGDLMFDVFTRSCYQQIPGQGPPPLNKPV